METKQSNRRAFFVLLFITLLILGILFRLAWIQIFASRAFSYKKVDLVYRSVDQRREKLVLNSGRGEITDRNGVPFIGKEVTGLAIFPVVHFSLQDEAKMTKLGEILGVAKDQIIATLKDAKHADFWRDEKGKIIPLTDQRAKEITDINITGLMALPVNERYEPGQLARQFIGYTGFKGGMERVGISGLEESFQPFLKGVGEKSISFFVDGRGKPLYGLNMQQKDQQNAFYPLSVQTTLDESVQKITEEAFDAAGVTEGAGVILDVSTHKVLAMVLVLPLSQKTPRNRKIRNFSKAH